jgi:hypothetical protein
LASATRAIQIAERIGRKIVVIITIYSTRWRWSSLDFTTTVAECPSKRREIRH